MRVDEFLAQLERVRKTGSGWSARCPAHEDRSPSLSIAEGDDGRVLVRCFAGCTADKITAALGLRLADLFADEATVERIYTTPRTPEARQATENQRLRRRVRVLELERRRALRALHRAALLVGIAYSDDPDAMLDRLWQGAVAELEREASAVADREGAT